MSNVAIQRLIDSEKMPLSLFTDMQTFFDRIREKAFSLFSQNGWIHGRALDDWLKAEREVFWVPQSELIERDKELELHISVPGFEPKDIEVTALPDSIVVRGAATHKSEKSEGKVHFSEFSDKQLYRWLTLPAAINVNKTTATLEKGVLKLIASKAAQTNEKGKKIAIAA
jgi:HSP20 family protein